ncbi:MAG: hypothetical protein JWQ37_21 [Blastococcus sp.]|nr:hypothetical protein [Blastococcus sp.]
MLLTFDVELHQIRAHQQPPDVYRRHVERGCDVTGHLGGEFGVRQQEGDRRCGRLVGRHQELHRRDSWVGDRRGGDRLHRFHLVESEVGPADLHREWMRLDGDMAYPGRSLGGLHGPVPDVGAELEHRLGVAAEVAPPGQQCWFPALLAVPVDLCEDERVGGDERQVRVVDQAEGRHRAGDAALPQSAEHHPAQSAGRRGPGGEPGDAVPWGRGRRTASATGTGSRPTTALATERADARVADRIMSRPRRRATGRDGARAAPLRWAPATAAP